MASRSSTKYRSDNIAKWSNSSSKDHCLEYVATRSGIKFINDSKATHVDLTWESLHRMKSPVVWIAGGVDRTADYSILKELVRDKVKAVIAIGKQNDKLRSVFQKLVPEFEEAKDTNEAVNVARRFARQGDIVLLSPACPSFDMYDNYEDRGMKFKEEVRRLK